VFDKIALLNRLDNDEKLCKELIEMFIEEVPVYVNNLKRFFKNNDISSVIHQAHTIKGASANVEAHGIKYWALKIEMAGTNNDFDRIYSYVKNFEGEFEKFKSAIENLVFSFNLN